MSFTLFDSFFYAASIVVPDYPVDPAAGLVATPAAYIETLDPEPAVKIQIWIFQRQILHTQQHQLLYRQHHQ